MTFSGANTRQKRIKFFTYRDYLFTLLVLEQVMNQGFESHTRLCDEALPPAYQASRVRDVVRNASDECPQSRELIGFNQLFAGHLIVLL